MMRAHRTALLAILAMAGTAVAQAQAPRRTVTIHLGVGVDDVRLGMTRAEIESRVRFTPDPNDPEATLPYTVRYRGGRAETFVVSLRDTHGVRINGAHSLRPDASYAEVMRHLGDCVPVEADPAYRASQCLGRAIAVVGTREPPYEVGIAVARFFEGPPLELVPRRSLGPIRIGMRRAEVAGAVRLAPAPPQLYPSTLDASNTVPYAVRYDENERVSAVFIHQDYLPSGIRLGRRVWDRDALAPTNLPREPARQRMMARPPEGVEMYARHGYIFGTSATTRPPARTATSRRARGFIRVTAAGIGPIRLGMTRTTIEGLGVDAARYHIVYDRRGEARIITYRVTGSEHDLLVAEGVRIPAGATWAELRRMSALRCARPDHREGGSFMSCLGGRLTLTRGSGSGDVRARIQRDD